MIEGSKIIENIIYRLFFIYNKYANRYIRIIINKYIDINDEMVDSETLLILQTVSKINEELTDIIYMIIDNKKS